jgi:hypothetical protein
MMQLCVPPDEEVTDEELPENAYNEYGITGLFDYVRRFRCGEKPGNPYQFALK